jgi:N-acetylneuraminate synthase/sialic acid synthase
MVKFRSATTGACIRRRKSRPAPTTSAHSYGRTYGEHREALELDADAFVAIKRHAEGARAWNSAPRRSTSRASISSNSSVSRHSKVASGDLTNLPFLRYIARLGKPMIVSTGAASLEEIRAAHDAVVALNEQLVLLHCIASYPAEHHHLNLRFIEVMQREFPDTIIGLSSHDNGLIAPVVAYVMGAVVVEKHFTLNRAGKGVDHSFSLEPEGLRKQVRDLRRVDVMLGTGERRVEPHEAAAGKKMGKPACPRRLAAGTVLAWRTSRSSLPAIGLRPRPPASSVGRTLVPDSPRKRRSL